MKKIYFTPILILAYIFSFGKEINSPSDEFVETIGLSQIHLQEIPIIYINMLDGKESLNTIEQEFILIEKNLSSLKKIITQTGNKCLKQQLKNITTSIKKFKKLTTLSSSNNFNTINKQQMLIQFRLNNIYEELDFEFTKLEKNAFEDTMKTNIFIANNQILNLKKYRFNQKMFDITQNPDYLISNRDILNELNTAIDKLIIHNTHNLDYDIKLTSLITLVNYMQYNESHMTTIVTDISLIFENIRDSYIEVRNQKSSFYSYN